MSKKIAIGIQDFAKIREMNYFYVDKTDFISEWWSGGDDVTLITRPRRFGKTLNMSMIEAFFSIDYAGRADLFEGLSIWKDEKYRALQGTYPVIFLSFANVKEADYLSARERICRLISEVYNKNWFLMESSLLKENEKADFLNVTNKKTLMSDEEAGMALYNLSGYLSRYYGKKVIILLDEYDTPMQEAYVSGYWNQLVSFTRGLFNSTFKTNPYLERGIMTGITRVSKESVFSDLNNLVVITTTSEKYADSFGFTEQEVFQALEKRGLSDQKENVKRWYDGFTFGNMTDIYNPWSIINFLQNRKFDTYWANTSSNSLVGKLIREGNPDVKMTMETLLTGGTLVTEIDEQIVFDQLQKSQNAIWSLLLASGYLKVISHHWDANGLNEYTLSLTNFEVKLMFESMIKEWFDHGETSFNGFIKALLANDLETMNAYMNEIAMESFSFFDSGKNLSESKVAERFYHGFVLGLLVDLRKIYRITSNRESGFGRYDVMLEPLNKNDDAIIIEFKVFNPKKEKSLEDTIASALEQIAEKQYDTELIARGISKEQIRHYGFAFEGKKVLIG
ncbi:MAG: AAA family ATPase [Lachnospiraceae bacterium]|nr:AAA family ATPase [Lachnospiraceae bacterium]